MIEVSEKEIHNLRVMVDTTDPCLVPRSEQVFH